MTCSSFSCTRALVVASSSRKRVPPSARSEAALMALGGAGEGARPWPNSSVSSRLCLKVAQLDGDKALIPAIREIM